MKIGSYYISLKSPSSLVVPAAAWAIIIAYLSESRNLFGNQSMMVVRLVFYPLILCTFFVLKSCFVVKKAADAGPADETFPVQDAASSRRQNKKKVIYSLLMISYLLLLSTLGFILDTLLFTAGTMFYLGVRKYKVLILTSLILTFFIYFLFGKWLLVDLPVGIFGF